MPTRYKKQIIIHVQDSSLASFAAANKSSFEQKNNRYSCVILSLPLSEEQLTEDFRHFTVDDTDSLRIIIAGHGASGYPYIVQLTEDRQKVEKKFSADDLANDIENILTKLGRSFQLPFTISIVGCDTSSDNHKFFRLIKYPSFAKVLQSKLYDKKIYPEITARGQTLMLQMDSKSKYTSYKSGSDLHQDQLILAELAWLRGNGLLEGISDDYWARVEDSFAEFLRLNAAVVRTLEQYNALKYIWQICPFSYFFPQYIQHCKEITAALANATKTILDFQKNCLYKKTISQLSRFTSFYFSSLPGSKKLFSYMTVDDNLIAVEFDDAYSAEAAAARTDYRRMILIHNGRDPSLDPLLTPSSIETDTEYRDQIRLWATEQYKVKHSRCVDISLGKPCTEEPFVRPKPDRTMQPS